MIKGVLYLLVVLMGIPSGLLLGRLCSDETDAWKKRLIWISILNLVLIFGFLMSGFEFKIPVVVGLCFSSVCFFTIVLKTSRR